MVNAKSLEKKVEHLEKMLLEWREMFSEKHMVELLSKALGTEERQVKLNRIIAAIIIGFIFQTVVLLFVIYTYHYG